MTAATIGIFVVMQRYILISGIMVIEDAIPGIRQDDSSQGYGGSGSATRSAHAGFEGWRTGGVRPNPVSSSILVWRFATIQSWKLAVGGETCWRNVRRISLVRKNRELFHFSVHPTSSEFPSMHSQ
jgi:hypothetical protein